ncbi:GTPase SAR1 [Paenibacillus apiarius]|uniref:GTPase SAR1 n=1 Tax=Paenibacillus apiarius TaxID=46240 RepID=UPI003B3ABA5B
MQASKWLIWIAAASILMWGVLWGIGRRMARSQVLTSRASVQHGGTDTANYYKQKLLRRCYYAAVHTPFLKRKAASLRLQLAPFYSYDEWLLREKTAAVLLGSGMTSILAGAVFLSFDQDVLSWFMLILVLSVAEGLYRDYVIQRAEFKLLKKTAAAFTDVRHAYHRHRMVDAALEEALESADPMIELHLQRLIVMVHDSEPEAALASYEEAAPNRYFKLFAGLSRLVAEYGDPRQKEGSSYLQGISMIVREMQLELVMRSKLEYLLRGLKAIAVIPILFTDPLEQWAKSYFPAMEWFYKSKLGWLLQLTVFLTVIVCHRLLQQLQWRHKSFNSRLQRRWTLHLWECKGMRCLLGRWLSRCNPVQLRKMQRLLDEANEGMPLEYFYGRRLLSACVTVVTGFVLLFMLQWQSTQWSWHQLQERIVPFGLTAENAKRSMNNSSIDSRNLLVTDKWNSFSHSRRSDGNEHRRNEASSAIAQYTAQLHNAHVKWWEFAIAILAGIAAYHFPVLMLHIRIRLQHIDMRTELSQFQSLTLLLRAFDRMTAEQVVEWMCRSSMFFRQALRTCAMNWESGPETALRQLKSDVPYPDFVRFAEKLELAHDLIPLQQAFDDVEQDWIYEQEMMKQYYEKSIEMKAGWGQWFGFAPMYALIFLYLVVPLVWMSAEQMRSSFEQIRQL